MFGLAPKMAVRISGTFLSNATVSLSSKELLHTVFPSAEMTCTPPTHDAPSPFAGPGGGGRFACASNWSFGPGIFASASRIAALHTSTSTARHRTTADFVSSFFAPAR